VSTPTLDFIRAHSVSEVATQVAASRAQGRVPLVGDPRWSMEHWDLVQERWSGATLPAEAAWVALSSGSTGNPRLIVRTQQSWAFSFPVLNEILGLSASDVFYLPGSPASSLALFSIAHAADLGARVGGDELLQSATFFHGTPSLLRALLQRIEAGLNCGIRVALVGGDVLDDSTRELAQSLGIKVVSYYGAAELSFVAIDVDGNGLRAFPGVETKIIDHQLWVRSPYRAIAYLGDGGALRETPDGWATVGDLATEHNGRLSIQGRADGAIQTAGATVIPEDVEQALCQLPGVQQIVVFGVPNSVIGNLVAAVLVYQPETTENLRTLKSAESAALVLLSHTHRPRLWFEAQSLPTTISGKPARKLIQAAAIAGEYRKLE
jgi:long-chain acyl-CoA synthetase